MYFGAKLKHDYTAFPEGLSGNHSSESIEQPNRCPSTPGGTEVLLAALAACISSHTIPQCTHMKNETANNIEERRKGRVKKQRETSSNEISWEEHLECYLRAKWILSI